MANPLCRIAWVVIVKGTDNEAPYLKQCLENIHDHVDALFININVPQGVILSQDVLDIAKAFTDNVWETVWEDDFAKARNFVLSKVPPEYTWVGWSDSDDTLDKPAKVREVCELSDRFDSIFVDYLYDRDEEDNPQTVHLVARLFKNNGSHKWRGRIHETLIEERGVTQGATKDFVVVHHADTIRTQQSFQRNIDLLEMQLMDEKDDPDPRTFYYLASTYMDSGHFDDALSLFTDYLTLSGWDQERSVALTKMGRIYLDKENRTQARECFARAVAEDPDNPEPRIELGSLEVELKRFDKARNWLEYVEKMEKNLTTLERNPLSYTFRTYLLLADVYLNLGGKHLPKAVEYADKALKYKKKNKQVRQYVKMVKSVAADYDLTRDLLTIYARLKKNKEQKKMDLLIQAVPKQLEDNPIFVKLRDKEPFIWPKQSIAIMTGDTMIDEWGPWSLEDGIGGSEEAIIRLSKHLNNLGYKVVVFAKPGPRAGEYDGVAWRNFWEININDEFDVFVAWRAPYLFDKDIKARKKYLWLHDVMEPGEFTAARLANLDKVMVLSKYHRSLFPVIPDNKIMLSGNGIDPDEFNNGPDDDPWIGRDPQKIFYGSSHVRGLAYLYEIWPQVKAAVPDATLDVYYGRESYDAVHRGNPERLKWMDDLIARGLQLDGVTDHGKVSQSDIVRHIFESGIWAYPCPFPEIYCITAIKAQAGGAIPVASNFAALDETIQFGTKLPMKEQKEGAKVGMGDTEFLKEYTEKLIWWLQHPEEQQKVRLPMMAWAKTQSWEAVAKQWHQDFQS